MKPTAPRYELSRVADDTQWEAVIVPIAQLALDTPMNRRGFLGAGVTASAVLGALTTGCGTLTAGWRSGSICNDTRAHRYNVSALIISPDGTMLVSGSYSISDDSPIKLWQLPDGALFKKVGGNDEGANVLAISPDGKTLASVGLGSDKPIKLWSLPDGALLKTLAGHKHSVSALAISPDGKTLTSGSNDKDESIKLWSLPDGALLKTLQGGATHLAITPDGKTLASVSRSGDNSIKLWSLPDGALLKTLERHSVTDLAISPDGKTLASGDADGSIKLWSLPDGALRKTLEGHTKSVEVLAITPDGKTLASESWDDNSIKLWSLADGAFLKTLAGHNRNVSALAISPDGKTLASGDAGGSIKLWSLPDGALLKTLAGHNVHVSLVISPDGKTLASASRSADGSITLWSLPDGAFIRCLMDISVSPSKVKGATYQLSNGYGQIITYTLPCGSPIPAGATCTCNCVPGSITPPPPPRQSRGSGNSWSEPCPGGPVAVPRGAICTCNCIPVCQAHRLLHPDPVVRTMAEEILFHMGSGESDYLHWAAEHAEPALRTRIHEVRVRIDAGVQPDPRRWPGTVACLDRLYDTDEVVAIMAAQTLHHLHRCENAAFGSSLQRRIATLLSDARQRPWFVRYNVARPYIGSQAAPV